MLKARDLDMKINDCAAGGNAKARSLQCANNQITPGLDEVRPMKNREDNVTEWREQAQVEQATAFLTWELDWKSAGSSSAIERGTWMACRNACVLAGTRTAHGLLGICCGHEGFYSSSLTILHALPYD